MLPLPAPAPPPCPPAEDQRAWTPLPNAAAAASIPSPTAEVAADFRHRLSPTPAGWPRRDHWCVWVEPAVNEGPAALWEQRWWRAVQAALTSWQQLLPIQRVTDPAQAQVLVQRRRPPIQNRRASHGRALLQLLEVQRSGMWQLEPRVEVLISPGQAEPAMQATALHELGHAFGLWGHSDQAGDAMAVSPGAQPVLQLSGRDRATLQWLQRQPGLQQERLAPPPVPSR